MGNRELKLTSTGKRREDVIDHVFHYGTPGDHPVAGDWNGDGIDTIGVFRDGRWHRDIDGDGQWTNSDVQENFGQKGDLPVVGDFNGDGIDELGVYRHGTWYIDTNGNRVIDGDDKVFELGGAGRQAGRGRLGRRRHERPWRLPRWSARGGAPCGSSRFAPPIT